MWLRGSRLESGANYLAETAIEHQCFRGKLRQIALDCACEKKFEQVARTTDNHGGNRAARRWQFFGIGMEIYPAMFVIINIVLGPQNCSRSALTSVAPDRP